MEARIEHGCYDDEYPIVKSDIRLINSAGLWGIPVGVQIVFDVRDAADQSAGILTVRLTNSECKLLISRLSSLAW